MSRVACTVLTTDSQEVVAPTQVTIGQEVAQPPSAAQPAASLPTTSQNIHTFSNTYLCLQCFKHLPLMTLAQTIRMKLTISKLRSCTSLNLFLILRLLNISSLFSGSFIRLLNKTSCLSLKNRIFHVRKHIAIQLYYRNQ